MAWSITLTDIKSAIQLDFPGATAERFNDIIAQQCLDSATAQVDSLLEYNDYDPAAIQALITTPAYKFCNHLVLRTAVTEALLLLRTSSASDVMIQALAAVQAEVEMKKKALKNEPRTVLGGATHTDESPTRKGFELVATGVSLDPATMPFTSDPIY